MNDHTADTGPITVVLTEWEFKACVDLANTRMAVSNAKHMNHASTYERTHLNRVEEEIVGACGEMAVCKALGRFWTPSVNTFHHTADIEPNIEVRATKKRDNCLIIRDNDPDHRYYFLVVGEPPKMTVIGYLMGAKAKQDKWIRDPGKRRRAWFVPQEALHRIKNPATRKEAHA